MTREGANCCPKSNYQILKLTHSHIDSVILSLFNYWYKIGDWEGDNNKIKIKNKYYE